MSYLMPTYARLPIAFSHGEGVYLWDTAGRQYLDFLAGIAVCQLGHAHPRLTAALTEQASKLWHVSNLFQIPEQEALAEALVARSGLSRVFFCNSGAEANEALIKLSRLWGKTHRDGAHEVIVLEQSFHGRTMATLSATGQDKVKIGFDPLVPTFKVVPPNDVSLLSAAITSATAGILIEVVQGEGGVRALSTDYLKTLRALCDQHHLFLMIDEVQTGLGRTGEWFGFQSVDAYPEFRPDAISLAKGLAGGLPMGACVVGEAAADLFKPGSHASTFGGTPLVSRVALELIRTIEDEELIEHSRLMGDYFYAGLCDLAKRYSIIQNVRGRGLMIGCELPTTVNGAAIVNAGLERGVILNVVQGHVLRFVPPLIIEESQIAQGLEALSQVLATL